MKQSFVVLLALALAACAFDPLGPSGVDDSDGSDAGNIDAGLTCPEAAACGSRVCGPDPLCGTSCGDCSAQLHCVEGACVANPPVLATLKGTVGGATFVPNDAIAHGGLRLLSIEVHGRSSTCAILQGGHFLANDPYIQLILNSFAVDLTSRTYLVNDAVSALFVPSSPNCSGSSVVATSGSVVITYLDLARAGDVRGTFDLRFGADHVTGSFLATPCAPFPEIDGCE